jgi:hypothetical protein
VSTSGHRVPLHSYRDYPCGTAIPAPGVPSAAVAARVRVTVTLTIGLALALGATAACGGSSGNAVRTVQQSPDRTIAARTARLAFTVATPEGAARTVPLTIVGEGEFDFRARRGRLRFDVPTTKPPQRVESVITPAVVFAKLPKDLLPLAGGAKPWIKLPAEAAASRAGLGVQGLESADVAQALQYLRGANDDVKRMGTDRLHAVKATHYRGTIDLERAAERSKEPSKSATRRLIGTLGGKTLPFDVWIDAQRRIRKLLLAPRQVKLTVELFDFGTRVTVADPPADQVTDLTGLIGR